MAAISLSNAARFSKDLPHQLEAWDWLQGQLTEQQLNTFAERFRTAPPPPPSQSLVTAEQCQQIFGRPITADQLADLNACMDRFEIDSTPRICHFMAQIAHESGGLRWLQEIADGRAYEGRRDLGNMQPGDGPRFKGAGAIQLTGRANYEAFAIFIADPQVMEGCQYVSSHYPFTSAGFWWHNNRMNQLVDSGADCRCISRFVNGRDPANGLAERETYFEKAKQVIGAEPVSTTSENSRLLSVPYFSQLDSSTAQASRMCFSSSCAMLVEALKPGALPQGDDQYLGIVNRFGDTTSAEAQIQALDSLGIKARMEKNGDFSMVEAQINRGIPVPCGFIHKGPVDALFGDGHWLCVVGYDPKAVIVNDPNGDLDLMSGVYGGRDGKALSYSRKNFGRRWMVDENCNYAFAPGKGWLIIAEPLN